MPQKDAERRKKSRFSPALLASLSAEILLSYVLLASFSPLLSVNYLDPPVFPRVFASSVCYNKFRHYPILYIIIGKSSRAWVSTLLFSLAGQEQNTELASFFFSLKISFYFLYLLNWSYKTQTES